MDAISAGRKTFAAPKTNSTTGAGAGADGPPCETHLAWPDVDISDPDVLVAVGYVDGKPAARDFRSSKIPYFSFSRRNFIPLFERVSEMFLTPFKIPVSIFCCKGTFRPFWTS